MSLLSRLRRTVKKVRLLLNFNAHRWRIASMIRGRSLSSSYRLSFNERPGLAGATDEYYYSASEDSISNRGQLQRTISYPSDQESDIDQRAEMFIANFRMRLQMERQISLELPYSISRGNSYDQSWKSP